MALEPASYINQLVPLNPRPGDPKHRGDDHIRLMKQVLVDTFPLFAGPMPIAHDQVASKNDIAQAQWKTILPAQPGGNVLYRLTSINGQAQWQSDSIFGDEQRLAEARAIALST